MRPDDNAIPEPLRIQPVSSAPRRLAYAIVAVVATGIGILGIWLPGLPTTPFILVGLWAAARSSERLASRLHRIRLLHHAIQVAEDYARDRSLPLRLKILSQVMAYSAIALVWVVSRSMWLTAVVACGAVASSVTMALTPTRIVPASVKTTEAGNTEADRNDGLVSGSVQSARQ